MRYIGSSSLGLGVLLRVSPSFDWNSDDPQPETSKTRLSAVIIAIIRVTGEYTFEYQYQSKIRGCKANIQCGESVTGQT